MSGSVEAHFPEVYDPSIGQVLQHGARQIAENTCQEIFHKSTIETPIWGPRRNRRKIYGKPIDACFTIEKSLTNTELISLTTTGTTAIDVRLSGASSRM